MMYKYMYFIFVALSLIMLTTFTLKTRINKGNNNGLSNLLLVNLFSNIVMSITYMYSLYKPTVAAFGINAIAFDSLFICFMIYTELFDEMKIVNNKKTLTFLKILSYVLMTIDSTILMLGIIEPNLSLYTVIDDIGKMSFTKYIQIHTVAMWVPMIIGCMILLQKRLALPSFYKKPYNVLMYTSICFMSMEMLHMKCFNEETIDFFIIGLPIEGVIMQYYSTQHRLDSLIRKSNDAVMDALNDGFILLDRDKKIIYKNHSVNTILPTDYEWEVLFDMFETNINECIEFSNKIYLIKSEDKNELNDKYLDISYQAIRDEKGKYVGSYFLLHDSTVSEKSRRKNDFIAKHNTLTGLYNKSEFCDVSKRHVLIHRDNNYILILFDIDKFKMINELFGNESGDRVLYTIANSMREYMSDKDGAYGHLGDDKFAILIQYDMFNENEFFKAIQSNLQIEQDTEYKIIMHAGICNIDVENYNEDELNISLFIDRAVLALADIKGDMQTRTAWYGPHITKTILQQQKVISEVDKALDNKNICFFVQPQTDADGNSMGGEALVRWIDPDKGIISPGEFVPVLEDKGLISKVDLYIWDLVCQKLKEWKDKGWDDYYLSVNISAKDMYYMNIFDEFTALIDKYELKPSSLRLEVTESAVMLDKGRQFDLLEKLRKFGFTIEIDDFGSGYSSLNMLKDIEFDMLKIDMAFLRETSHVDKSKKIITSVIQMAQCIGTDVITEGVETEDQLEFLNAAGCNHFQGYYFDKPLPVEKFEEKYLNKNNKDNKNDKDECLEEEGNNEEKRA